MQAGNTSVTKNDIPFVSIGADHACEHLNKLMKIHSGLVGISNNANARQRFFMVTPELSRVVKEFKSQASVKKENNKMFMSANKKTTVKLLDKTVDLKETKALYGRLMVLARSSRDINQKKAIGNHKFTLTPRALFAPDGTILPNQS